MQLNYRPALKIKLLYLQLLVMTRFRRAEAKNHCCVSIFLDTRQSALSQLRALMVNLQGRFIIHTENFQRTKTHSPHFVQ